MNSYTYTEKDYPPGYDPRKDHVELLPYNPEWELIARLEIEKLRKILPTELILDIQHVGSTAIPNIMSKPIIDIQIAVASLEKIKPIAIAVIEALSYTFWDKNPDQERLFFVKGMPPFGEKRTHHIHIFEKTSKHWRDKIAFRDYLKSYPKVAKQYEKLKLSLAQQYMYDREKYTEAKKDFVSDVLQKSLGQ